MEVTEVQSKSQLRKFLNVPGIIYPKDSRYVRPLNFHMKMMLGKVPKKNKHLLLATNKEGKPVARIGFKTHTHKDKKYLHFGFFECHKDAKEAPKLFFNWAKEKYPNLTIRGPYHFRMEDPYVGILVEGFDRDPFFLMPYNPEYYDHYLQSAGLTQLMDLFTYELDQELGAEAILPHSNKASENGVSIRNLNMNHVRKEAESIARIFNEALSRNWGFEEFEEAQINEMVSLLKTFIDPRVVQFAVKDGKDIGCLLMIPNYNPILKGHSGRITPSLIFKFLTKRRKMTGIRGYALGVLSEYHGLGVGSLLTTSMFETGGKAGYRKGEISWVLANNGPMNELSKAMGGKHNKVYRVYELGKQ